MQLSSVRLSATPAARPQALAAAAEVGVEVGALPRETFTASAHSSDLPGSAILPSFRVGVEQGEGPAIQLQVRFPEESNHFQAWYDDKSGQIVFSDARPIPEEHDGYLIR